MDRRGNRYSATTADPSTALPRISCGDPWRWGPACGSLYGEPHTWTSLAARSRKSGSAPVEMTKGRVVMARGRGLGDVQTAGPSAAVGMIRVEMTLLREK